MRNKLILTMVVTKKKSMHVKQKIKKNNQVEAEEKNYLMTTLIRKKEGDIRKEKLLVMFISKRNNE